jgi:hypothetical protein
MKAIAPEEIEQTIATEDTLRLIVDTTPTLIHTGRPDGYLDYFNRGLFPRESEGSQRVARPRPARAGRCRKGVFCGSGRRQRARKGDKENVRTQ